MMANIVIKSGIIPTSKWQICLSIIVINSLVGLVLFMVLLMPQQRKLQSLNLAIQKIKQQQILNQQRVKQLPLLERQIVVLKNYYKHNVWLANPSKTITTLYDMASQSGFNTIKIALSKGLYQLTGKLSIAALLKFLQQLNHHTNTLAINNLRFAAVADNDYQLNLEMGHLSSTKIDMTATSGIAPLPEFVYQKWFDKQYRGFFADKNIGDLQMIGYVKSDCQVYAFVADKQSHNIALLQIGQYLTQQQMKTINITPDYLELVDMKNQKFILPMSMDVNISNN